jgi:hypothetical protein
VVVPGHLIRKPDPCIYSQFMLMQMNQPVTWDNPDVRLFLGGIEQDTYNLTADTEYEVEVTVHNTSRDKPANGTTVKIDWIEFGAGAPTHHAIALLPVNVPVWPGTNVIQAKWRTPVTPGHYCIEVDLSHPDDGNPANNRGWNNTQVHAANSPVRRSIRIFNRYLNGCPEVKEGGGPWLRPHRVFLGWGVLGAVGFLFLRHSMLHEFPPVWRGLALMALGYAFLSILGLFSESIYAWIKRRRNEQRDRKESPRDRRNCNLVEISLDSYRFEDKVGKDFDPAVAFQGKAPEWPAQVVPAMFAFAPNEAFRDVELQVDAPDVAGPPGHFNLSVRQGGVPTGGVTFTITTGGA